MTSPAFRCPPPPIALPPSSVPTCASVDPLGESHSPVVHELWVLVVAGSNPASPTKIFA